MIKGIALLLLPSAFLYTTTFAQQQLSFSLPDSINTAAITDKPVGSIVFKGNNFICWNDKADGSIHIANLGEPATKSGITDESITSSQSSSAPALISSREHIYVLWIDHSGKINYTFNTNEADFKDSATHQFQNCDLPSVAVNIFGLKIDDTKSLVLLQTKTETWYATVTFAPDGLINCSSLKKAPYHIPYGSMSAANIKDNNVRVIWSGGKGAVAYADLSLGKDNWTDVKKLTQIPAGSAVAVHQFQNSDNLFYLWKGVKKDNKLYYLTDDNGTGSKKATFVPEYISTLNLVSVTDVGENHLLSYVGINNKIYQSRITTYNPATWMEDTFFHGKEDYHLTDIIIPGAHDAGMSVLTAAGGQQSETINECNTLTQIQDVKGQLNAGIRMLDLRIGSYNKKLYTKHCSSDCMADAIGGGYGERLGSIITAIKDFLDANKKETVIISFSHFCEKEAPAAEVAQFIVDSLGKDKMFFSSGRKLNEVTLKDVAGKAIITFEEYASADNRIDSCTIAAESKAFINFRREYAATNVLANLVTKERAFFTTIGNNKVKYNDLVRLDWQLTQTADEAAMVCNDFQSEELNPIVDGAIFLTNVFRKHHSIRDLSLTGKKPIFLLMNKWLADGTLNKNNKPNILYVDVADSWATGYCIQLNKQAIYNK
ncbi:phosphatidylinositol-specific phospholipase C domain-containing protein [Mucilaginibacter agri]|uniref:1-phosphatidylinositol phosphodiesterase n=1 Tax=Mucilaginibacter agri TaxID=2695265 RepID=A0A966DT76_9SPHI|nr:phosphatidylinositol-specific phospholipase C domain-containing protein [Mucilaginibacter agri]NCD68439.1 hypothetical protein [Mucilaginibacter agri]